ncbi:hypothetical protein quinque_009155 [Culex quinquefasciatus]
MVNLCAWNDTTGIKEHVMESFFAPHPNDTCFLKVTQNCIQESLLPLSQEAHNSRAYAVFKCYLRHYGDLVHEAKFVPNEHLEFDQLIQDCFTLANIPRDELVQYSRGNIIDGASFPRGFLIGCVRLGYYSLQTGVNLGTFYAQFGNREILSQQTRECCERSAREHCDGDHATRLYHIFRNCLVDIVPTLGLVQKYAKSLVGEVWDGRWRQVIRKCGSVAKTAVTGVCSWGVYENGVYWEECYCGENGCNSAPRSVSIAVSSLVCLLGASFLAMKRYLV